MPLQITEEKNTYWLKKAQSIQAYQTYIWLRIDYYFLSAFVSTHIVYDFAN